MTAKSFEEFDKWLEGRSLSIEKTVDGWGQPRYLHPHIQSMFDGWNASRAALLADHDVAGLVKWLRSQYNRQGLIGHSTAADALESLAYQLTLFKAENAMLAAQVAERDAEIAKLKMETEGYPGIGHDLETERQKVSELRGRMRVMTNIMGDALSVLNTIPEEESDEESRLDDLRAKMAGAIDSVLRTEKASIYRETK